MDLASLRVEIDQVDQELLTLFLRRMKIVEDIASYKIENGLPVLHPARELEVVAKARYQAGDAMGGYARQLFECLMSLSRDMQQKLIEQKHSQST